MTEEQYQNRTDACPGHFRLEPIFHSEDMCKFDTNNNNSSGRQNELYYKLIIDGHCGGLLYLPSSFFGQIL